jgi:2-alkenal reductase
LENPAENMLKKLEYRSFLIGITVSAVILVSAVFGALADRLFVIAPLDAIVARDGSGVFKSEVSQKLISEENVVISVAENVSPSVVTVSAQSPKRRVLNFNPFGGGFSSSIEGGEPQDIGSGFIVSADGVIVTNKHVVSDTGVTYKVITKDGSEYDVQEINRDPSNDLAVLKINANGLSPVNLGSSSELKAGQFVIAIGTALGEFRHTVTTGVISGLGRGITAGSAYEGFVEHLDDVIQTDAAINPGNSGGPLLNSAGEVIGVNVAVAEGAQNIGFAIPIDIVKNQLGTFNSTGKFPAKPFLGVQYQMIGKESAILNEVPQGAYVTDVIIGSPADTVGILMGDIITKLDNESIQDDNSLANIIADKVVGSSVDIEIWRDGKTLKLSASLTEFSDQ